MTGLMKVEPAPVSWGLRGSGYRGGKRAAGADEEGFQFHIFTCYLENPGVLRVPGQRIA